MKFYITTTLPYVNAEPHLGFALEIIQADVIARYRRAAGDEVFFNTGTDEHGLKIYRKAQEQKKEPPAYVDEYAAKFDKLKSALNLSYNAFIRTTDKHHQAAAQEFWRRCLAHGDIYKKNYQVKYCVGCELEKTESELVKGKCPLHPEAELELLDEENYFFRFSKYQAPLLKLYKDRPDFVAPIWRLKEITNFVAGGLEDFSISRLKSKMPWGVSVPDDDDQVMYVWFDALVNYISTLGWPADSAGRPAKHSGNENDEISNFEKYWPGTQIAGKDNLRQQAAMWQAMLMSARLPNSKQILIHGFITAAGQKMSKSSGNVVDPYELVNKYGTDAVRYYLLAEIPPFEDGDFTLEKFNQRYNGDLANGLGNLVARLATLLEKDKIELSLAPGGDQALAGRVAAKMVDYKFNEALLELWQVLRQADATLAEKKPWEIKDMAAKKAVLAPLAQDVLNVATLLAPFLPATAEKIIVQFTARQIVKAESLFPRK